MQSLSYQNSIQQIMARINFKKIKPLHFVYKVRYDALILRAKISKQICASKSARIYEKWANMKITVQYKIIFFEK